MEELLDVDGGEDCQVNQVLYNLSRRGPEYDLLPFLATQRNPGHGLQPDRAGAAAEDRARWPKSAGNTVSTLSPWRLPGYCAVPT